MMSVTGDSETASRTAHPGGVAVPREETSNPPGDSDVPAITEALRVWRERAGDDLRLQVFLAWGAMTRLLPSDTDGGRLQRDEALAQLTTDAPAPMTAGQIREICYVRNAVANDPTPCPQETLRRAVGLVEAFVCALRPPELHRWTVDVGRR